MAGIDSSHGLRPSGSVMILYKVCCGRSRLLNRPCGRKLGNILHERGLYLKSKGRGMVFGMLLWSQGLLVGWMLLGSNLMNHSFFLFALHSLQSAMKVRKTVFCLQGIFFPARGWLHMGKCHSSRLWCAILCTFSLSCSSLVLFWGIVPWSCHFVSCLLAFWNLLAVQIFYNLPIFWVELSFLESFATVASAAATTRGFIISWVTGSGCFWFS